MVEVTSSMQWNKYATVADPASMDDWLGFDHNVETPVYLIVQPSTASESANWGIAWPVGGLTAEQMTAWRHLEVNACPLLVPDDSEQPHFKYDGPMTKSGDPTSPKLLLIANATLAKREKIQQLARSNNRVISGQNSSPVGHPCETWVKTLLGSMVDEGLLSVSERNRVIQDASAL